jgi:hypothetical protein
LAIGKIQRAIVSALSLSGCTIPIAKADFLIEIRFFLSPCNILFINKITNTQSFHFAIFRAQVAHYLFARKEMKQLLIVDSLW